MNLKAMMPYRVGAGREDCLKIPSVYFVPKYPCSDLSQVRYKNRQRHGEHVRISCLRLRIGLVELVLRVAARGGRSMRAITVEPGKAGSARLDEVSEPDVREGDVLVQAVAVGVCGTDVE